MTQGLLQPVDAAVGAHHVEEREAGATASKVLVFVGAHGENDVRCHGLEHLCICVNVRSTNESREGLNNGHQSPNDRFEH